MAFKIMSHFNSLIYLFGLVSIPVYPLFSRFLCSVNFADFLNYFIKWSVIDYKFLFYRNILNIKGIIGAYKTYKVIFFTVLLRKRLLSAGLEPVLSHIKKYVQHQITYNFL